MKKIFASKFGLIILVLVLFALNFLASAFHYRLDLTKEKRYTLSKTTRDLLKNLDDVVSVDVFLKGDFPAGFKKLTKSTQEFLELMKDNNSSKITFRFISPEDEMHEEPGRRYADTLISLGANPINLSVQIKEGQKQQIVFPVAIVKYKDRSSLVQLYSGSKRIITQEEINNAEALMEYQFVKNLDELIDTKQPSIAYATGNGEPTGAETYDFQRVAGRRYKLCMF